MRKRIALCMMMLGVMLCVGCNTGNVEPQNATEEQPTTQPVDVTEQKEETQNTTEVSDDESDRVIEEDLIISDSYDDMYAVIFDNYHKALEESWDKDRLLEANISEKLLQFYGDGNG